MKPRSILLFLTFAIVSLAILCMVFPSSGIGIGGHVWHLPTIESIIAPQKQAASIEIEEELPSEELLQLNDSIAYYQHLVDSSELRIVLPEENYLNVFWEAADRAKGQDRVVRILHYGDSQIEMDHMSSQLRSYMQKTFGGGGPGLIPFRTLIPTYAVRQSTRGKLTHLSSFGDSTVVHSKGNYGPMMQSFRLYGSATADVKASTVSFVDERVKKFSRIRLLFNNIGNGIKAHVTPAPTDSNSINMQTWSLDGTGIMTWRYDSSITHFQMHVSGRADIYGILADDGSGVAVDNIPMRGCSGKQFTLVDEELLRTTYRKMDIGMIIMQFGGNTVPYMESGKKLDSYCKSIGEQIDYIHQCCPQARILFIGPSDMSTRSKGKYQTYPVIPELIDSLTAVAIRHGAAYWSIYHAMGGENTMPEWVNQGLAGKDYIHFTQHGANVMGDRLARALDNSYRLYLLKRKKETENV